MHISALHNLICIYTLYFDIFMYTYVYLYIYIYMHIYVNICMCVSIHTSIRIDANTCMYIQTFTYRHIDQFAL